MGLDFMEVNTKTIQKGKDYYIREVYPSFLIGKFKDIMIRGNDIYAVWDEEDKLWKTDELDIIPIIDREIRKVANEMKDVIKEPLVPLYLRNADNKMIDKWHQYCKKQLSDSYKPLDTSIIFDTDERKRESYATKYLPYHPEDKETPAYTELSTTLYSPEELHKIEWCIGAILNGASKKLQKFLVITGDAGSGKSTMLNIMEMLFDGYCEAFRSKDITNQNQFGLEQLRTNPLIAIEHDGNLSKIFDNSTLNSLISHETMTINEKYHSPYKMKMDTFLVMASNLSVEITDAKSGLTRRIIDAEPTGNKVPNKKYNRLMEQIKFELGGIAKHCLDLYLAEPHKYDKYRPEKQISNTYRFYDFIDWVNEDFKEAGDITLDYAWSKYKKYIELADVKYPFDRLRFKTELKEFYKEFYPRKRTENGYQRNVYSGYIEDRLASKKEVDESDDIPEWLKLENYDYSKFDNLVRNCRAQYTLDNEKPVSKWENVKNNLIDLDPTKLHYVMPQDQCPKLICVDFDIRGENGEKDLMANLLAASKFPPTYAETSKSGQGLHLYYIYDGDIEMLSAIFDVNVEVKVFKGNASLRRKLSLCNNYDISHISSGLPLKEGDKKVVNKEAVKSERELRKKVLKCLKKEYEPHATGPMIDLIKTITDQAYESGLVYDISDMYQVISDFASNSSNQASRCKKVVVNLKLKSKEAEEELKIVPYSEDAPIVFFDMEVFPNVFMLCWKVKGKGKVTKMINPSAKELRKLMDFRLVGFNNRSYDNHILYAAAYGGYSPRQLFKLSQNIINKNVARDEICRSAYEISYADVYEYAATKQSLKKWEIELGLYHKENQYAWDEDLPEEHWEEVADYCANDVIATEKVAEHLHQDFVAREILAKLSGLTVNHTTRQHTTKIIFGDDKNPELNYEDLSETFPGYTFDEFRIPKSDYMGEDPSEGGYVYAEPGIHEWVALLDVASLHPHSILALNLFKEYTSRFEDILNARIAIKHHDYKKVKTMLNGILAEFISNDDDADNLAYALKIVINSVYGYTSATFPNPFKDERNKDNIVAKRGALFMITLKHEVQKLGYTVAHIKTDSIKIPNADTKIIDFCMEFGKKYGYTFEHEATYEKMCLVNDAVYIAKYASEKDCKKLYGYSPKDCSKHGGEWTATGTQFQVPYVYKTLFSHEPIEFNDICETKTVTSAMYIDLTPDAEERSLQFIGKVGRFTPVKPDCGGGKLLRDAGKGKYSAVTGTKNYLWIESDTLKEMGNWEDKVDISYYANLVDAAKAAIEEHGDFNKFVDNDMALAA